VSTDALGFLRHFIVTTTLYMRLDRVGGVGKRVFLPVWALEAATQGILETLAGRPDSRDIPSVSEASRGLSPDAWRDVLAADPDFAVDPDAGFLLSRLEGHLADLTGVLSV
jgi:hypothetical protein